MKSPPVQFTDEQAHEMVEDFIGNAPSARVSWTEFFPIDA
jgi:hypothetical protein